MEIEIWACCYSEKADVSLSFGTSVKSIDCVFSSLDTEWLYDGIGDSFWEIHEEFEVGIAQAESMQKSDSTLTLRQALFEVFGNFRVSYEVNGKELPLDIIFDANAVMYSLLEA